MNNKLVLIIVVLTLLTTCISGGRNNELTTTEHKNMERKIEMNKNHTSCSDYFIISNTIEKDSLFRTKLGMYLYRALVGGYDCNLDSTSLAELYQRESFQNAIFMFYNGDHLIYLNHYESESRWREGLVELLYGIDNRSVLTEIADSLLVNLQFDGIRVLWDDAEIKELTALDKFFQQTVNSNNFFKMAELSAFYHVNRIYDRRDKLMDAMSKLNDFNEKFAAIESLYSNMNQFEYVKIFDILYS